MGKSNYHPYMRPILKGFENKKFINQSKKILRYLSQTILKKVNWSKDADWVYIEPVNLRVPKDKWRPKIYVCVSVKDYWPVISDLILLSSFEKFNWKFCRNMKGLSRSDKIVIYCHDAREMKRIIRIVRPLLKGKHFHDLRFASSTVQSKIEKSGKGIYVGSDPLFLSGVSWRFYRWAIGEAIIKTNMKEGRLNQDTKEALKKLNISLKHEGPNTLNPAKRNNKFIKKMWKEVIL